MTRTMPRLFFTAVMIRLATILPVLFAPLYTLHAQTTYNVTASSLSAYTINSQSNPTLTLQRGVTYTFNVNAFGHPFFIKTALTTGAGDQFTQGVTGNGVEVGTLTFSVPANAPDQLFYHCGVHFAMGGTINITGGVNSPPSVTILNPLSVLETLATFSPSFTVTMFPV